MIKNKEFHGTILKKKDPRNRGRYQVHLPELLNFDNCRVGLWCKNRIHSYRASKNSYGQYLPLQEETHVLVRFTNLLDLNSGEIFEIINDDDNNTQPLNISANDRDDFTQIIRTHVNNNIIAICENTTTQPANSFHIYTNNKYNKIIYDSSGIHIFTSGNENVTISGNSNIKINGTHNITISGDCNINSGGNCNLTSGGDINLNAGGNVNIQAGGNINEIGSKINMNSGGSAANAATTNGYAGNELNGV